MALPRIQPIIPTWRKQPFDDPGWLFDCKYDGFRAMCYVEQGRGRFVTRNGNLMGRFDELGDQLAALLDLDEAILDGEVIAADATGRPQFYDLLRGAQAPAYVAFDILWADAGGLSRSLGSFRGRSLCGFACYRLASDPLSFRNPDVAGGDDLGPSLYSPQPGGVFRNRPGAFNLGLLSSTRSKRSLKSSNLGLIDHNPAAQRDSRSSVQRSGPPRVGELNDRRSDPAPVIRTVVIAVIRQLVGSVVVSQGLTCR